MWDYLVKMFQPKQTPEPKDPGGPLGPDEMFTMVHCNGKEIPVRTKKPYSDPHQTLRHLDNSVVEDLAKKYSF